MRVKHQVFTFTARFGIEHALFNSAKLPYLFMVIS